MLAATGGPKMNSRHACILLAGVLVLGFATYKFTSAVNKAEMPELPIPPDSPVAQGQPERIGVPVGGRIEKTEAEWRAQLTPEQFHVARQKGTERAFSGALWDCHEDGVYRCVCCGQPLFDSKTKFESGTGWPSFWKAVDDNNVSLFKDESYGMQRVEVVCSRCNAHLGHLFDDGPQPTGQRFCMNSASLKFAPRGEKASGDDKPKDSK
jgi:peptide-methionine (R)-S-oxide reductase